MEAKDRIIVALDVPNAEEAKPIIDELGDQVGMFKIGLELIMSGDGHIIADYIADPNLIFWDCKLKDIGTTVARASALIEARGYLMFNVHADRESTIRAALSETESSVLLAVTVLTDMSESECRKEHHGTTLKQLVIQRVRNAEAAGAGGIICAPTDLTFVQNNLKRIQLIVTPGVRPPWAERNDQARVATPGQAVRDGANFIVIGRPIRDANKYGLTRIEAVMRITEEIEEMSS